MKGKPLTHLTEATFLTGYPSAFFQLEEKANWLDKIFYWPPMYPSLSSSL